MGNGGRVERRLSWYWQVELANAAFIPAFLLFLARWFGEGIAWPVFAALVPVSGLLVIGGAYWRGRYQALKGKRAALDAALALADRWDRPLMFMTILVVTLAAASFALPLARGMASDRWVVLAAACLALAEYVNYYQRQLQHFDNWPDFQRLMTGRGFRPAKMAVDLAAWRARRGRARG